jgi:hypothetical protein
MDNIRLFKDYKINENFYIPNVKIDEFLPNVEFASDKHVIAIEDHYKTYKQYISIVDKKKHIFKVNDITGDLLNNNRVVMEVHCFHTYEVDKIKENIINYCITTFYNELPQQITTFGVTISPLSLINKEELKKTFETKLTKESVIKIISVITGFAYDGVKNDFYIWKKGI